MSLISFLGGITDAFPPREKCAHQITLSKNRLTLTLFIDERYYDFSIDESDIDRPIDEVTREISTLLVTMKASAQ